MPPRRAAHTAFVRSKIQCRRLGALARCARRRGIRLGWWDEQCSIAERGEVACMVNTVAKTRMHVSPAVCVSTCLAAYAQPTNKFPRDMYKMRITPDIESTIMYFDKSNTCMSLGTPDPVVAIYSMWRFARLIERQTHEPAAPRTFSFVNIVKTGNMCADVDIDRLKSIDQTGVGLERDLFQGARISTLPGVKGTLFKRGKYHVQGADTPTAAEEKARALVRYILAHNKERCLF